jgi:hypothetical protein
VLLLHSPLTSLLKRGSTTAFELSQLSSSFFPWLESHSQHPVTELNNQPSVWSDFDLRGLLCGGVALATRKFWAGGLRGIDSDGFQFV